MFKFPKNLTPELELYIFFFGGGGDVFPLLLLVVCLLYSIVLNFGMNINTAVRK